jgi:hypothetical protein
MTVDEEEQSCQQEGKHRQGKDTVAPATAPLEIGGGAGEVGEYVQIGKVGSGDQCGGAECGPSAQSAAGEGGTDQRMANRVYSSLASMSS